MTVEMQDSLRRELEGAMSSGDENRIRCAHSNIMLALMDCQAKMGARVKRLQWKFTLATFALGAGGGTALSNWDFISRIFLGN